MPRSTLMVDAWAWIALYNPADQYHDIARLANEELLAARYSLLTTNFILLPIPASQALSKYTAVAM